jgi:hypothetical protein
MPGGSEWAETKNPANMRGFYEGGRRIAPASAGLTATGYGAATPAAPEALIYFWVTANFHWHRPTQSRLRRGEAASR